MKKPIYCDNSSTSFPKAPGLGAAMVEQIENRAFNISRGGYSGAYKLEAEIIATRELVGNFFGFANLKNIVFTPGATWGLNMIIKGLLKPGDHVISSSMEHNAVVRPLFELSRQGVEWSQAACDNQGNLPFSAISSLLKPNTRLIILNQASNVSGTIIDLEQISKTCKQKGIFLAIDAAQSAGSQLIDLSQIAVDALVFPAHKALLGPQGLGVILVSDKLAAALQPLILGGTGSISDQEVMPEFMPDKLQPGTLNIPGIIGLKHSLNYINEQGIKQIIAHKRQLTALFLERVANMERIKLIGRPDTINRTSVISLDFSEHFDNAEIAYILEQDYGILTRCGLHCAPQAHKSFGSFPQGTVRFSFGYFNTAAEVLAVVDGLARIMKG